MKSTRTIPIRHEDKTKGGLFGHVLRRIIHISMVFVPFLYYFYGETIANSFAISLNSLVVITLIIILLLEGIRLIFNITLLGQRQHEAKQISSFAWGAMGLCMVLLFAPGKAYGIPIIACLALVDPLMGELRRLKIHRIIVALIGIVVAGLIWLLSAYLLGTPFWIVWVIAPLTIAAEWPNLKWIDDNATMQLIPLIIILLINSIFAL